MSGSNGYAHSGKSPAVAAWDVAVHQLSEVRDRKRVACGKAPVDVEVLDRWLTLEAKAVAHERQAAMAATAETIRADQAATLRESLLSHYQDLGPQYPILVERLVQAEMRAISCDALGDTLETAVHISVAKEIRAGVAALQRYTESVKQEIIQKRVEMQVVRVVEIIEAVVLPVAPQLWNDVIAAIAERAPSLED